MIKKIFAIGLSLLLLVCLAVPASAMGFVYDETEQMDSLRLNQLQTQMIPGIYDATGIQTEVYLLTYMVEGDTLEDFGTRLYENGEYADQDYVSLLMLVEYDGEDWALNKDDPFAVIVGGNISNLSTSEGTSLQESLSEVLGEYAYSYQWDGNIHEDKMHFWQVVEAFLFGIERFARANEMDTYNRLEYVMDEAQLLNPEQREELNAFAQSVAQEHQCGLYIMTVDDFWDYSSKNDMFNATWDIYHRRQLGVGPEREGLIVMLSMQDRDCALFVYGDRAENAFNLYGQEQLEAEYLDYFRQDDWYGGYSAFMTTAKEYLALEAEGDPVRDNPTGPILFFVGIAWLAALAITTVTYNTMKNVRTMKQASRYIAAEGLQITHEEDIYVRSTRTVVNLQTDRDGSGGSSGRSGARVGGGGSGRSSKF